MSADHPTMADLHDIPVEVAMTDGSRWVIYYRLDAGKTYANALAYLREDIKASRLAPAEDLDRVQRRLSQINMAHIVSVREPEKTERG